MYVYRSGRDPCMSSIDRGGLLPWFQRILNMKEEKRRKNNFTRTWYQPLLRDTQRAVAGEGGAREACGDNLK
jgi:hypothetical protein